MLAWMEFRSHKVFHCLTDAPDTCIPFSRGTEQLHHFRRERRRVQEKPAFVENSNAWLAGLPSGAGCHSVRDEHTHSRFELWVGAQSFDIEEQPITVELHRGVRVEQLRVDPPFSRPATKLDCCQTSFVNRALHLLLVTPLRELFPKVVEGGNRVRVPNGAPLIGPRNRIAQQVINERVIRPGTVADHVASQVLEKRDLLLARRCFSRGQIPRIKRLRTVQPHVDDAPAHQLHERPIGIAAFNDRDLRVSTRHHEQEKLGHEGLAASGLRHHQHVCVAEA